MSPENEALSDRAFNTLGLLSHKAAQADAFLYEVFHALSGCSHAIAKAIYYTLEALSARQALTRRVAFAKEVDEETKKLLDELYKLVAAVSGNRNDLAHSIFVTTWTEDAEMRVHRVNPKKQENATTEVTVAMLDHMRKQSDDALVAAMEQFSKVCQKLGIPPAIHL